MACPAAPGHYQYNPLRTLRTAIDGVWNVMELAKQCNARVLQASTSEVYGEPLVHPQTEDYRGNVNCIGPRSCYDEGKRVGETIMFDYHRMYNTDIKAPTRPAMFCASAASFWEEGPLISLVWCMADHPNLQHLRPSHAPL